MVLAERIKVAPDFRVDVPSFLMLILAELFLVFLEIKQFLFA
jgi:hypothetical protein